MMVTAKMYRKQLKDADIAEIIKTRDFLIDEIREYEDAKSKGCEVLMCPDPFALYLNNHECLIEISKMILERITSENCNEVFERLNDC